MIKIIEITKKKNAESDRCGVRCAGLHLFIYLYFFFRATRSKTWKPTRSTWYQFRFLIPKDLARMQPSLLWLMKEVSLFLFLYNTSLLISPYKRKSKWFRWNGIFLKKDNNSRTNSKQFSEYEKKKTNLKNFPIRRKFAELNFTEKENKIRMLREKKLGE